MEEKYSELISKYDDLYFENAQSSLQTKQYDRERNELKCGLKELEQTCTKLSAEKDELIAMLTRDESEKVQV